MMRADLYRHGLGPDAFYGEHVTDHDGRLCCGGTDSPVRIACTMVEPAGGFALVCRTCLRWLFVRANFARGRGKGGKGGRR